MSSASTWLKMICANSMLVVCGAAIFSGVPTSARSQAANLSNVIVQEPGLDPAGSALLMRFRADAAARRAAWATAHPGADAASRSVTGPQFTGGAVTSSSIVIGDALAQPTISFRFSDRSAPVSSGFFIFTSPSGFQKVYPQFSIPNFPKHGQLTFETGTPLTLFAEPGAWTMSAAYLFDDGGNQTVYNQAQLAAIFSQNTFTVINTGTPDGTPPAVSGGRITTPTVKLSDPYPEIKGYVTASDAVSGAYSALVYFLPPGGQFSQGGYYPLPLAIRSGKVPFFFPLGATYPTGHYTITEYQVCDLAGNCLTDTSDADIVALFGTDYVRVKQ